MLSGKKMSTKPSLLTPSKSTLPMDYPGEPPLMSPLRLGKPDQVPIYKFVLTGGPCAGKTTALARLSTYLRDRGFRVYLVPEAATMLQLGGVSFLELKEYDHVKNFQWQILNMQIQLEDSFMSLAKDTGKPCILLCDRGAMDGSAYISVDMWEDIKADHDLDTVTLRDTRYNAVFHLVTAANGAESFYTLTNNGARTEGVELACELDKKTCNAWMGHPKLFVFDNSTDFEGKMQRLVNTASRLCGLPSTLKSTRKFRLVAPPDFSKVPVRYETFEVEKVYLQPEQAQNSADYSFVRCRSQYGIPAYGMTTVRRLESGEEVDLKRVISGREYAYAVQHRKDIDRHVIKQVRYCFLWNGQSFQVHVYKEPAEIAGLAIAHIQVSSSDQELALPPFLNVAEEIKEGEKEYSAHQISLK